MGSFNLRVGEEELLAGDIATGTLRRVCEFVCHVVGCDQTIRQREVIIVTECVNRGNPC